MIFREALKAVLAKSNVPQSTAMVKPQWVSDSVAQARLQPLEHYTLMGADVEEEHRVAGDAVDEDEVSSMRNSENDGGDSGHTGSFRSGGGFWRW